MIVRLLIAALLALTALAACHRRRTRDRAGRRRDSIDPHYNNAAPNNSIAEQIFNKLIENDARQKPKPGLAESWQHDRRPHLGIQAAPRREISRRLRFHRRGRRVFDRAARASSTARRFHHLYARDHGKNHRRSVHDPAEDRDALSATCRSTWRDSSSCRARPRRARAARISIPARRRSAPARASSCAMSKATASSSRATTITGARSRRGTK